MKVAGKELTAIGEIVPPGIPRERVVHTVRVAWANSIFPGVSQNRIECRGWERIERVPSSWEPIASRWSEPVVIWRDQADVPNEPGKSD